MNQRHSVSVTSLSWIPWEAMTGVMRLPMDPGIGHYDDPSPEYPQRALLGHSAIGYAVELGDKAGVGEVILFHHDPGRTDAALDRIADGLPVGVRLARQGMRW